MKNEVAVKMMEREWSMEKGISTRESSAEECNVETISNTPQNLECQCYGHELAFRMSSCVAEAGGIFKY